MTTVIANGETQLHKLPFFVRSKVRRNAESFTRDRGITLIDAETLYDSKAHYSRSAKSIRHFAGRVQRKPMAP